jgi:hypothetical protein
VNADAQTRVALALPVRSAGTIRAATQLIIYLLRSLGRIEMDLLERPTAADRPDRSRDVPTVLLIGAQVRLSTADPTARDEFERNLRAEIERRYARHRITPV